MSGMEQVVSQWDKTELINVTGTENVIKACKMAGVRGLVYTSSYNMVFGGQEIINGDDSLPYFPLHKHVDHYSGTTAIAERLVLSSDARNSSELCSNLSLSTWYSGLLELWDLEKNAIYPVL